MDVMPVMPVVETSLVIPQISFLEYRYLCQTEEKYITEWRQSVQSAPSICKNNAAHNVDWATLTVSAVQNYPLITATKRTGLTVTNHLGLLGVPSATQVDIASGACIDSTNQYTLTLFSTKTADITTNGVNGLDTGAVAPSTWYAVLIIAKQDGTTNTLLTSNFLSPTLPTDYVIGRLIDWIATNANSDIITFT